MTNLEVFVAAMTLFGLVAGSLMNVVISRLPRMMEAAWHTDCVEFLELAPSRRPARFTLGHPPSSCPACGHQISLLENVPVLSYVALGGRCSACHWKIPLRYPIVEIGGALVGAVAALHFGIGAAAAGACVLGLGLLALSAIDFENQLLPDAMTLPLLWLGLAFNLFDTFSTLRDGVLGAMAGYVVLWTVYHAFKFVTGRSGMGYGDFKLLALIGAWLGWQALPGVILLGSLAGAIAGAALVACGRASRAAPFPFGPYLAGAGLFMLYCGDNLSPLLAASLAATT